MTLLWIYWANVNSNVADLIFDYVELFLMLVTIIITAWAARRIRKWKNSDLRPLGYRWNFQNEGAFLIFWVA